MIVKSLENLERVTVTVRLVSETIDMLSKAE